MAFAADCIGEEAKRVVAALRPGEVALLENLRFHKGEEANSPEFARALAELGDLYNTQGKPEVGPLAGR